MLLVLYPASLWKRWRFSRFFLLDDALGYRIQHAVHFFQLGQLGDAWIVEVAELGQTEFLSAVPQLLFLLQLLLARLNLFSFGRCHRFDISGRGYGRDCLFIASFLAAGVSPQIVDCLDFSISTYFVVCKSVLKIHAMISWLSRISTIFLEHGLVSKLLAEPWETNIVIRTRYNCSIGCRRNLERTWNFGWSIRVQCFFWWRWEVGRLWIEIYLVIRNSLFNTRTSFTLFL